MNNLTQHQNERTYPTPTLPARYSSRRDTINLLSINDSLAFVGQGEQIWEGMKWFKIQSMPQDGKFYLTKISDDKGERNIQSLKRQGNLFFTVDGMYVYYTQTHYLAYENHQTTP